MDDSERSRDDTTRAPAREGESVAACPGGGGGTGAGGDEVALGALDREVDFERLYAEQFERVVALVFTLSGSRWAAEELAQDAFTKAYRHWDRLVDFDDAGAWVRRVAMNAAVSRHRRAVAEARALVRLRGRRQGVPAPLGPPDHEFWREVRALPRQQAKAVALHYLDDLSVAAIAQVLGCSDATVKVHLHRGRRTLAGRLDAAGFRSGDGGDGDRGDGADRGGGGDGDGGTGGGRGDGDDRGDGGGGGDRGGGGDGGGGDGGAGRSGDGGDGDRGDGAGGTGGDRGGGDRGDGGGGPCGAGRSEER